MAIYEVTDHEIRPVRPTTFMEAKVYERSDLQRLLRQKIEVIAPGCMVLAEEFGDWDDSKRRIDLLALDTDANLVVIELKRTEDGGHMDLQAIRYAAMVSTMTFDQAVRAHERYLKSIEVDLDAREEILKFLDWDEADDENFAQDVRIVLTAAEFSRELTSAVLWLNPRGIDIRCVRLSPYADGNRLLLDIQQVLPLPEAEEYQVRVREKSQKEHVSRVESRDLTKYMVKCGNTELGPLSKRETVFRVIKYLCDQKHTTPELIQKAVSFRAGNCFQHAEGSFGSEEDFLSAVETRCSAINKRFDHYRWYTGDDERIESDGVTYAVSNQWGGRAIEWLNQVLDAFPGSGVSVRAAKRS